MSPTSSWRARTQEERVRAEVKRWVNQFTTDPAQPTDATTAWTEAVVEAVGRVLYELDRLGDAVVFGPGWHTISYHAAVAAQAGNPAGIAVCAALGLIDRDHCRRVLASESGRPSPPWVPI